MSDDDGMEVFTTLGFIVAVVAFLSIFIGLGYLWGSNSCNGVKPDNSTPTMEGTK